mgnify:CR=1 FL=1
MHTCLETGQVKLKAAGCDHLNFDTLASIMVSMGLVENRQTSYCRKSFLSNDLLFHLKPDHKKSATISRVPEREPFGIMEFILTTVLPGLILPQFITWL